MQIVCSSDHTAHRIKAILAQYGLYERDGYLTNRPISDPNVYIAVWGQPPQELREAVQQIVGATVQD